MMKIFFFLLMLLIFQKFWLNQMLIMLIVLMLVMKFSSVNYWSYLSYGFGMDLISFGLIMLSCWISVLMLMASSEIFNMSNKKKFFIFNVNFMLISLILVFSTSNMFIFYLFFEISLIPIMLMIFGWGYQPERIQAGVYMMLYTLFMSLPMMMGIFYIYYELNSLILYFLMKLDLNSLFLYLLMILAFLVKMPMVFMHLWLPKAHVEAPISGSMILAGVMLKLGGYGLIRFLVMFETLSMKFNIYILSLSLVGGFYMSLVCLQQVDLKSLVAYSSVVHMGMVLSGLLILSYWGVMGSYLVLIGHGFCSSALFCLVNFNYERFHSRTFYFNKGMLNFLPSMSFWWFLFISANMAAPPSLNLVGEISLINSLLSWSIDLMLILGLLSFFSALFSLYIYIYSQYGKFMLNINNFSSNYSREYMLMLFHWIPLNFLILKVDWLLIFF
uniref:NADH-ubiquinone oxidoreductase chain 4 n=1 Tax=Marilia sp. XG-2021 TaxID=2996736 RepID=A0A9E8RTU8_9NEOP|nr:NADH dehydrogenase subunit 4 [Marilia sp. XG-2021]